MKKLAYRDNRSDGRNRGIWNRIRSFLPRTIGLILLIVLLKRIDIHQLVEILQNAHIGMVILAILMSFGLIGIKTIRWQLILRKLDISILTRNAFLAYFASIFIGFMTPGRLGEFSRALYIHDNLNVKSGVGLASVLADRLFDLYMLLLVGSAALLSLVGTSEYWFLVVPFLVVSLFPVVLFLHGYTFNRLKGIASRMGGIGKRLFNQGRWLVGVRDGLLRLEIGDLGKSIVLTLTAYLVYFTQCYLLAKSLDIEISFSSLMFAVALGSLITLLPFSISGLGTREATIVSYLSAVHVPAETALSFSFLIFITFYLAGGFIGALAWLVHPIHLDIGRREANRDVDE